MWGPCLATVASYYLHPNGLNRRLDVLAWPPNFDFQVIGIDFAIKTIFIKN